MYKVYLLSNAETLSWTVDHKVLSVNLSHSDAKGLFLCNVAMNQIITVAYIHNDTWVDTGMQPNKYSVEIETMCKSVPHFVLTIHIVYTSFKAFSFTYKIFLSWNLNILKQCLYILWNTFHTNLNANIYSCILRCVFHLVHKHDKSASVWHQQCFLNDLLNVYGKTALSNWRSLDHFVLEHCSVSPLAPTVSLPSTPWLPVTAGVGSHKRATASTPLHQWNITT